MESKESENKSAIYNGISPLMTEENKIKNVKTTIVKMFVNRGFIDKDNQKKYIDKLVEEVNDDHIYTLNLDHSKNYNTEIPNKKIIIKLYDGNITSVAKGTDMFDFMNKYKEEYKFIVAKNINISLTDYDTEVEVFLFQEVYINIVDHVLVPKHIVLSEEEKKELFQSYCVTKNNMPRIMVKDPVARYYKMKVNEVCKIIRTNSATIESPFYRLVVKN